MISRLWFVGLLLTLGVPLGAAPGRITGRVIDAQQQAPLEYATVLLYRLPDSTQVTGAATDARGRFELAGLKPGRYFLTVDFIGYKKHTFGPVTISPNQPTVDVGTLALEPAVLVTAPVEVTAQAPPVTFQVDRKVVHVSRDAAASSGTALDVLEKVPSVTVDVEGNVQLRGSSNFTLLIDGRPTVLTPSEALAQIPASIIDRIEIITSPSARYDPEGEVGILNVVLKKRRAPGWGGIAHGYLGSGMTYGGDLLLNRRSGPVNLYLSVYGHRRSWPGTFSARELYEGDSASLDRVASGTYEHRGTPWGMRGGLEFSPNPKNFFSIGGSGGQWQMSRQLHLQYREIYPDSEVQYTTESLWERTSPYASLFATYQHNFEGQEHRLSLDLSYTRRSGDEHSQTLTAQASDTTGTRSTEQGPIRQYRARLEYRRPLGPEGRLELGYEGRATRSRTLKNYAVYDSGAYVIQPDYGYDFRFFRGHQAIYGLLAHESQRLGVQAGLRLEYTHRNLRLVGTGETFTLNRWHYFPSFHLSYRWASQQQLMLGYSRRIRRPRSWWLEPYLTWVDPHHVHRGNPNLRPQYTHSAELSFQTPLGFALLTMEVYGRRTQNRIERVDQSYQPGVILHTYENVGTATALGGDLTVDADPFPLWNLRFTADFHRYWLQEPDGTSRSSWNHALRIRSEFQWPPYGRMQVSTRYHSPSVTSQGTRKGYLTVDLAWKLRLSRNLSLTLQVRDALATSRWAFDSRGDGFHLYRRYQRQAPRFSLSLRYVFNNYRPKRTRRPAQEEDMGEEGMDLFSP